jgi:predicted outer membrane repeat protein
MPSAIDRPRHIGIYRCGSILKDSLIAVIIFQLTPISLQLKTKGLNILNLISLLRQGFHRSIVIFILSSALLFGGLPLHAGAATTVILLVAPGGATSGVTCGTDWSTPCELYYALDSRASDAAVSYEIWAKTGSYFPNPIDGRAGTFQLKNNVALYGGFSGDETDRSQRHPGSFTATILSGDIDGAAGTDHSYHVVTGSGTAASAVLDGFLITAGNANGTSGVQHYGGGMYSLNGSPTLSNLTFDQNNASGDGGGLFQGNSSPLMTAITFTQNSAMWGGGLFNDSSSPQIIDSSFSDNHSSLGGGAIYNASNSHAVLTNVTFANNDSGNNGGAMYNYSGASPVLTHVTFTNNHTYANGGAIYDLVAQDVLSDVTFSGNTAKVGGGLFLWLSHSTLNNVTFTSNIASTTGGAISTDTDNSTLTGVTFSANQANYGGGMYLDNSSGSIILNSTFSGNQSTASGGAIFIHAMSVPVLINVTISGNTAGTEGSAMYSDPCYATVRNIIVWGNTPTANPIQCVNGSGITVTYSDIQGGFGGTGNLNQDPLLGALSANGGLTQTMALQAGSPAISAVPLAQCTQADGVTPLLRDQRGVVRPQRGSCDMGAFERVFVFLPKVIQ